jgi:two-component system, chemotaxis family, chemotaxis protein CheY
MSRKRILVADSNTNDREAIARWLSSHGYDVLVAEDGAETVNTVRAHLPDLVLLNTHFPPDVGHGGGAFEDGFLIIDWLKRLNQGESIRYLLITEEDAAKLHDKAKASGAKGIFQKPMDPNALLSVIQRLLPATPQPPE